MGESVRDEFDLTKDISYEEILFSLLDSKDLELKTDIRSPQKLSGLKIYANWLKDIGFNNSGKYLDVYIEILNKFMVSYNRQSRKEIISAVRSMFERTSASISLSERLTSNLAK
ncbi:MAG: hypothetical protein GF317_03565 [Candidatus Lokiarchaeota archaeon]|nr:hypothetical protein [Candidatus Lokiarchaeota archaeon]